MAARNTASSKTKSAVLEDAPEAPTKDEAPKKETTQQLKNRLRNEAEREVLNNHREEFHAVAEKKFADHGLKFERRLTQKERAAREIEKKLQQFPELRGQFTMNENREPVGEDVPDPEDAMESYGQELDEYYSNNN